MEPFLQYLKARYPVTGILVYGSFADGANDPESDFDAIVLTDGGAETHDGTVVNGTPLDVFLCPEERLCGDFDCEAYLPAAWATVVYDQNGAAERLRKTVSDYAAAIPPKTDEEKRRLREWCGKTLRRAGRGDAEGNFRRAWLLTDSLEIWCELNDIPYRGVKKALHTLAETDPEASRLYTRALSEETPDALSAWIAFLLR